MTKEQQQATDRWRAAAANLSHFNAAEGDMYRKESEARELAKSEYGLACEACTEAGVCWMELWKAGYYLT